MSLYQRGGRGGCAVETGGVVFDLLFIQNHSDGQVLKLHIEKRALLIRLAGRIGNRARVFCGEPCSQTRHCSSTSLSGVLTTSNRYSGYAFPSAMTVSGAYPVRPWMSSKRALRERCRAIRLRISVSMREDQEISTAMGHFCFFTPFSGTVVYGDFQPWALPSAIWSYCKSLPTALNRRVFFGPPCVSVGFDERPRP